MRGTRRLVGALSVGVLALGMTMGMAGTASADLQPSPNYNELVSSIIDSAGAPTCLDVTNGATSGGTDMQIFHCHASASNGAPQRFLVTAQQPDQYFIFSESASKCMTPKTVGQNGPILAGQSVVDQPCQTTTAYDLWQAATAPGNRFELVNVANPSLCMGIQNGPSLGDHSQVVMVDCNALPQLTFWRLG